MGDEQGEKESVKLQRMLSSLIADKRKMFELMTRILDRGKKDRDAELVKYVPSCCRPVKTPSPKKQRLRN